MTGVALGLAFLVVGVSLWQVVREMRAGSDLRQIDEATAERARMGEAIRG